MRLRTELNQVGGSHSPQVTFMLSAPGIKHFYYPAIPRISEAGERVGAAAGALPAEPVALPRGARLKVGTGAACTGSRPESIRFLGELAGSGTFKRRSWLAKARSAA